MNSFLELCNEYCNHDWFINIHGTFCTANLNKLFDLILSLETNLDEIMYTLT